MSIKVISQTTAERNAETKKLFEECKPYLDDGLSLNQAVQKAKGIEHHAVSRRAWFRELREYAEEQGYFTRI